MVATRELPAIPFANCCALIWPCQYCMYFNTTTTCSVTQALTSKPSTLYCTCMPGFELFSLFCRSVPVVAPPAHQYGAGVASPRRCCSATPALCAYGAQPTGRSAQSRPLVRPRRRCRPAARHRRAPLCLIVSWQSYLPTRRRPYGCSCCAAWNGTCPSRRRDCWDPASWLATRRTGACPQAGTVRAHTA